MGTCVDATADGMTMQLMMIRRDVATDVQQCNGGQVGCVRDTDTTPDCFLWGAGGTFMTQRHCKIAKSYM
jgi:hypothetical protein